jgi:hypothetical protein
MPAGIASAIPLEQLSPQDPAHLPHGRADRHFTGFEIQVSQSLAIPRLGLPPTRGDPRGHIHGHLTKELFTTLLQVSRRLSHPLARCATIR